MRQNPQMPDAGHAFGWAVIFMALAALADVYPPVLHRLFMSVPAQAVAEVVMEAKCGRVSWK